MLPVGMMLPLHTSKHQEADTGLFKFASDWFKTVLEEGSAIWKARNLEKHGKDKEDSVPWLELKGRYSRALAYLKSAGSKLPNYDERRHVNRYTMQRWIDRADNHRLQRSMLAYLRDQTGQPLSAQQRRRVAAASSRSTTPIQFELRSKPRFLAPHY